MAKHPKAPPVKAPPPKIKPVKANEKKKPTKSRTKRVVEKASEELGKRSKAATPAKGRAKPTIVSSEGTGVRTPLKRI